jgi:hypothetical protein
VTVAVGARNATERLPDAVVPQAAVTDTATVALPLQAPVQVIAFVPAPAVIVPFVTVH